MATAIKAIPTLKGKEAREFLRHAEEAERNYKGTNNRDDHSFCQMAIRYIVAWRFYLIAAHSMN